MKLKLKTRRAAKKRFQFTKKGKIKHKKSGLRHLLTLSKRSEGRKRHLKKMGYVHASDVHRIEQALPYR